MLCEREDLVPGVVLRHFEEAAGPVQQVLRRVFNPYEVHCKAERLFGDVLAFNCRTTALELLVYALRQMDEAIHAYGLPSDVRVLREACRMLSGRLMLAFCVAYNAPTASAAHTSARSWSEFEPWSRFLTLWRNEITKYLLSLSESFAAHTLCLSTVVPMTADQITDACRRGELSKDVCFMYEVTQTEMSSSHYRLPVAYHVPVERCANVTTFGLIWFVKCVCAFLAFLLFSWLAVKVVVVVSRTTRFLVGEAIAALINLCSHLRARIQFRSSLRVVKQATEEMTGVSSALEAKPIYKMMGMVANSFDSLEMSMSGSEIRTSGVVPGCVHLVMVTEGEVLFVGMAFRYNDYLVTAHHNIHAMSSTPGKSFIVPFKPDGKKEHSQLDMDSMLELTEEMMSRDIVSGRYAGFDATVIPMEAADWSKLGVQSLKHADAIWNSGVTAYGLEKSGKRKLQRSMGTILKGEDHELTDVFYSASTLKGWSGSPILSGQKRVVALHCGTNGQQNRGLNFAYIRFFIDVYESSGLESNEPESKKYLRSFRGSNGRLAMRREELELERLEDEAHALDSKVYVNRTSNGLIWMSTSDHKSSSRPATTEFVWADECALQITQQEPREIEEAVLKKPSTPRRNDLFAFATDAPFVVERTKQLVSAPYYKGRLPDHDKHVDIEEAKRLGYQPGVFEMPRAVDRETANARAKKSLSLNLEGAVKVRRDYEPPSNALRSEAKMLMIDMLKPNRYVTDCSGVTKEKILAQLNSSAVSSSKSPGLPYILEGFQTNADVIKGHSSLDELAERILRAYKEDTWCTDSVNFHKIEPTKTAKLDDELDRTVQSVGLEAQIVMRCFFAELMDSSVEATRKSPVVAGWSPLKPGDGKFMYDTLAKKGNKLFGYDGKNFEFNAHTECAYNDVSEVMVGLAVPAPKVSKEALRNWRREALTVMDKMGRAGYHCADGTVIKKLVPFILSSGRFDTYIRNSFTGLYWFTIGALQIELSHDEIKAIPKKFGGDDVMLSVKPNFDCEGLVDAMRSFGQNIHKIEVTEPEQGFDFFSWHFTKKKGAVTWVPTRFSKHVENFFNTKHDYRADALVAHMLNWVHSTEHFDFWREIYLTSMKASPEKYPIEALPDQEQIVCHLQGYESLVRDPDLLERVTASAVQEQKGCSESDDTLRC